ncbi:MAG TPA: hypothetical protein VFR67_11440, partial [Pilimelia sp.]|nr:hypothetical protein [Pilimelia sp.]
RRAVLGTLGLAAVATPLGLTRGLASAAVIPADDAGVMAPTLVWNPNISAEGVRIFEGLEEDRANSHPGFDHIVSQGEDIWFYMHRRDRDTTGGGDRQRHETKGMRAGGTTLRPRDGETWRIRYEMFMPSTLHGTSKFTHIFQLKTPETNGGPWITLSLSRSGSSERMRLRAFSTSGAPDVGSTNLAPLRDKWITVDMTFRIGSSGTARFVVRNGTGDGAPVVVDSSRSGVRIPDEGDYVRPKWGIYRSVESASSDIIDTHLRLRRMQAWRGV